MSRAATTAMTITDVRAKKRKPSHLPLTRKKTTERMMTVRRVLLPITTLTILASTSPSVTRTTPTIDLIRCSTNRPHFTSKYPLVATRRDPVLQTVVAMLSHRISSLTKSSRAHISRAQAVLASIAHHKPAIRLTMTLATLSHLLPSNPSLMNSNFLSRQRCAPTTCKPMQ